MSNGKKETIKDIVSEMRIGDLCASDTAARSMYINDFLASYADRIEAAHKREMADEKRISDAVIQSLRDKKLEMAGEIAAKEEEVVRLRELVSELLNKLVINHCIGCQVDDCDGCVYYAQNEAVAAKAREMIGGAE